MATTKKPYEDLQMGYDRTQVYKEFIQPQINRTSALNNVMSFVKMMKINPTTEELFLLVERFQMFIETGDKQWVTKVDTWLKDKYEEQEY
jgi:hypothetical protein